MEKMYGQVKKIIYTNEENTYTVLSVAMPDGSNQVLVGYIPYVGVGEMLEAEGSYKTHKQYGQQFFADSVKFSVPLGKDGIIEYLSGGTFKGVGHSIAEKIYDAFGDNVFEVISNEPDKLAKIQGMTKKRAADMTQKYKFSYSVRGVISELSAYDIPPYMAARIYRRFGTASAEMIRKNPYVLCDESFGFPFEQADRLAEEFGVSKDSEFRTEAGIEYVLRHNLNNGHTFLPYESLCSVAGHMLECGDDAVAETLEKMKLHKLLVEQQIANIRAVYLYDYAESEKYTAKRLLEMSLHTAKDDYSDIISVIEKELGLEFAPLQKRAILKSAQNNVFILTGGPGTGKTTTLIGMVRLFSAIGYTYALAAPTGRAAKRMTEITGEESKTVHRLLETNKPEGGRSVFNRNEKNPIEEEIVIVDEASMLDTKIFEALLRAMRPESRLILVGDADQLPPVGAGNVLRDMLKSDLFTSISLTEIFRQAQGSLIVVNAHEVNNGNYPDCESIESDFFFVKRADKESIAATCLRLVSKSLPKKFGYDPIKDIQLITPTHNGASGTAELNKMLQATLNPPAAGKDECSFIDRVFRSGDKVMQIRNNYDLVWVRTDTGEVGDGIYNGDIGVITEINAANRYMMVDFEGRNCEITFDLLADIELAYAITVHKSQGNEFPCVVMPAYFAGRLTTRNLLYTAITRAKEMMVLVGMPEAVRAMVDNNKETRRFTGLKYLMLSMAEEAE